MKVGPRTAAPPVLLPHELRSGERRGATIEHITSRLLVDDLKQCRCFPNGSAFNHHASQQ